MTAPARHTNNFDALRLFAALAVILHHTTTLHILPRAAHDVSFGFVGVATFFIISGYLIMMSWDRKPVIWPFVRARVLRIFPGLIGAVLVTALVIGPLLTTLSLGEYFIAGWWRYLATIDLIHLDQGLPGVVFAYGYPVSVNTPLWTLPVELKMYLFLLILGVAGALRGKAFLLAAFALALLGAYRPTGPVFEFLTYWGITPFISGLLGATNNYPLFFLAGSLLYVFKDSIPLRGSVAAVLFVAWLAGHYTNHVEGISLVCMPYFVLCAGLARTRGLCDVSRIGDLSYGLYIYAFPIQHVWMKVTGLNARGHGSLFALVAATTAPVAFGSWHLIEKRALRLKSRA